MKATDKKPKRTSKAMMRPLLHEYFDPPHCRARRRQTTAGTSNNVPRKSILWSFFLREIESNSGRLGSLRTRRIARMVKPPNGRFM